MNDTELEERLRHGLRAVAHATAVPARPELARPAPARSGLRTLAVAAAVLVILGAVALGQLAGAWSDPVPAGPGPRGEGPALPVQKLVSLEDPEAAQQEVDGTFRALELDVTMVLKSVGPDRAGRLLGFEGGIEVESEEETCDARTLPGCRIQITTPAGFEGHAVITVGRYLAEEEDEEGSGREPIEVSGDAFGVGQPLHCQDELLGATLAVVRDRLQQLGLPSQAVYEGLKLSDGADGTLHVTGAGIADGVVVLLVQPDPYRPSPEQRGAARVGC